MSDRAAVLREIDLGAPEAKQAFDRLTRLAARLLAAPVSLVTLVEEARQVVLGQTGLGEPWASRGEMPLRYSYCQHALESSEPLLIPDARRDPRVRSSPAVSENRSIAYAGAPLRTEQGHPVGTLCVIDTRPRDWTPEEVRSLRDLAAEAMTEIQLRRSVEERERMLAKLHRESELLDLAHDAILIRQEGHAVQRWNGGAERMYGWSRGEMLGRNVHEVLRTEFPRPLEQVEQELYDAGRWQGDLLQTTRSGERIIVASHWALQRNAAGYPVAVLEVNRDISQRRRAEQALRDTNARLEGEVRARTARLVEAQRIARLGHWELIEPAGELYWSDEVYGIFGRSPAGFTPSPGRVLDCIHPDDRARVEELLRRIRAGWPAFEFEHRIVLPSGETRVVHERGEAVRDANGTELRVVGTVQDVTERRQTEEALRRSETRYRRLVDHAPVCIFGLDAEGRLREVNPAGEEILGRGAEELVGRRLVDLLAPADRAAVSEALRSVLSGADETLSLEFRIVRPDGECRDCHMVTTAVHDGGSVVGSQGVLLDFTEQRAAERSLSASERRFRALIEQSSEIVTVLSADGVIRYESPPVERVLGYTPEERVGKDVFTFLHPDDVERVRRALQKGIADRAPTSAEFRVRHRDGSWKILSATGTSLLEDPAVEGVVINSRDITELHQSEERLRQAQKMEAIGRLAGGIAHDFNNILAVIQASTAMALMDVDPTSPVHQEIEEIDLAAQRAANLTRQLLVFSRREVVQPEVVDLNGLVRELEKMLRRLLGEDIEFVTRLDPGPAPVFADPGQIQQVLMNLAVNARDAMPHGGRLITETRCMELRERFPKGLGAEVQPGRYVMLAVSDTGTGIPAEVQDRIFEPFYTTKPAGQGTGLGLSTVYGIVTQAGGYIWAYSEPGRGTTFELYFPQVAQGEQPAPVPDRDEPEVRHATILLAEDDPALRATARRLLERLGHTVLEAGDGEEALRIADRQGPEIDLLLTDVVMPRMSGRELAEQVTARWPGVRVLYASGYTDEAVVRHGVLDGTTAFLQKPYQPAELAARITEALTRSGASR